MEIAGGLFHVYHKVQITISIFHVLYPPNLILMITLFCSLFQIMHNLVINIPLNYHLTLVSLWFLLQIHVSSFPKQQYQHSTLRWIARNGHKGNYNKIIRLLGQSKPFKPIMPKYAPENDIYH